MFNTNVSLKPIHPSKHEFNVNAEQCKSYLTENTQRLRYNDQPINVV
jgi:hypothetical protein